MSFLPLIEDLSSGLRVRIAALREELENAEALVASRYAWRGYPSDRLLSSARSFTLIAERDACTVGTLTLRKDSDDGLLVDGNYREKIDHFRAAGRSVCEVTRLATAPQNDWRAVLGLLFQLTYGVCRKLHESTDLFIEVNPRHARFYRGLEFVVAAGLSVCPRVQAPALLLHLDLLNMADPNCLALGRAA